MDHRAEPELLFYAPVPGHPTAFYACSFRDREAPAAARELLTVGNLSAEHVVMSPTPCQPHAHLRGPRGGVPRLQPLHRRPRHAAAVRAGGGGGLAATVPRRRAVPQHHDAVVPVRAVQRRARLRRGHRRAQGRQALQETERRGELRGVHARGADGWRPCAGQVLPHVTSFLVGMPPVSLDGFLYWLRSPFVGYAEVLEEPIIMSFNVSTEQFGWVHMPPELARRTSHLANLDGSLCVVLDSRCFFELYELYTWSGAASPSPSWSPRCSINLQSLPEQVSDELLEERDVIPLCSSAGGGGKGKILLATGRHKVFAYDGERGTVEHVFRMQDFVDVPEDHLQARLLLNVRRPPRRTRRRRRPPRRREEAADEAWTARQHGGEARGVGRAPR